MKILVLGATGQIGHAVTCALARTGHQITAMVRDSAHIDFPNNVRIIERSRFAPETFAAALRDIDHVIYSLGLPEQFTFDETIFDDVNCRLLNTFLEAMRGSNVRRLTYLSTYEVFAAQKGVIAEDFPLASEAGMSEYSRTKIRAYQQVKQFAAETGIQLTTIHPGAAYGGLATGDGVTNYMENLLHWRAWLVPFVGPSSFPVVHVDSLSDLILRTLDRPGAYIAADGMTSLAGIAAAMRAQTQSSYVPLLVPAQLVNFGVAAMEAIAKVLPIKPLIAQVQLDFMTRGWRPDATKAMREPGWRPMSLEEGVKRYLAHAAPPLPLTTPAPSLAPVASAQHRTAA